MVKTRESCPSYRSILLRLVLHIFHTQNLIMTRLTTNVAQSTSVSQFQKYIVTAQTRTNRQRHLYGQTPNTGFEPMTAILQQPVTVHKLNAYFK